MSDWRSSPVANEKLISRVRSLADPSKGTKLASAFVSCPDIESKLKSGSVGDCLNCSNSMVGVSPSGLSAATRRSMKAELTDLGKTRQATTIVMADLKANGTTIAIPSK